MCQLLQKLHFFQTHSTRRVSHLHDTVLSQSRDFLVGLKKLDGSLHYEKARLAGSTLSASPTNAADRGTTKRPRRLLNCVKPEESAAYPTFQKTENDAKQSTRFSVFAIAIIRFQTVPPSMYSPLQWAKAGRVGT